MKEKRFTTDLNSRNFSTIYNYLKFVITSNCRQIWCSDQPVSLIVSSIVGSVNEQNSIVINVCAEDWTAEMSTIASNAR